jgi:hypothetical protein
LQFFFLPQQFSGQKSNRDKWKRLIEKESANPSKHKKSNSKPTAIDSADSVFYGSQTNKERKQPEEIRRNSLS